MDAGEHKRKYWRVYQHQRVENFHELEERCAELSADKVLLEMEVKELKVLRENYLRDFFEHARRKNVNYF